MLFSLISIKQRHLRSAAFAAPSHQLPSARYFASKRGLRRFRPLDRWPSRRGQPRGRDRFVGCRHTATGDKQIVHFFGDKAAVRNVESSVSLHPGDLHPFSAGGMDIDRITAFRDRLFKLSPVDHIVLGEDVLAHDSPRFANADLGCRAGDRRPFKAGDPLFPGNPPPSTLVCGPHIPLLSGRPPSSHPNPEPASC